MKKVFMMLAFAAMLFASVSCACGNCKKGEAAAEEEAVECVADSAACCGACADSTKCEGCEKPCENCCKAE